MFDLSWGRAVAGEVIGDGGMGTVYSGWLYYNPQGALAGRAAHPVAIKVLHPTLATKPHVLKLFRGEAEALGALSHPGIVHFFGMYEAGPVLAILLELVDGQSLDRVVERHVARAVPGGLPALPFARAWHYFQQLLGALAATHALGIIHRDVKPANLLIRRDGLAKLTDYGIARLPSDAARSSGGMQPGTGAYMSPEQVLGKPLDGRSDLYSAAIVLFEMLTGRTPFDAPGKSELMIRASQLDDFPPPLSDLVPSAPQVLDRLLSRALAKDPAHRFASAIELGDAFRRAIAIPDTAGWQAQQAIAAHAPAMVAGPIVRGGTRPLPVHEADRMRQAVAQAYAGAVTPSAGPVT